MSIYWISNYNTPTECQLPPSWFQIKSSKYFWSFIMTFWARTLHSSIGSWDFLSRIQVAEKLKIKKIQLNFNSLAGCRTIFNCIILIYASRALPEFQGYKVRRYPDQQPPAPPSIQPRRLELPPTFSEDQEWRKIGARRTKFLDLGMPRFGQPKRIHVKQSSLGGSY